MTRPDPAEPSMDEILASIRKIIAEDPIGSTGGPDDGPPKPPAAMKDAASSGEFDLPSVFRPKPAPERGGSLFGRLTGAAGATPAPQATPAPFTASLGHRAKPADEQLSDLVENDLGDLLADSDAPAAAVVPPPAPGLPPGASLSVLPITELMRADTDSHVADMPEPSPPARSEPRFTAMPPPAAPASKPGRLEDRLPPIAAHPSGMGRTEPPHDTASRDQAIANALGALVPGKIDQPMTGFRLPPIGGAPSGPSSFGRVRPGATVEAPAAEAVAVPQPPAAASVAAPAADTPAAPAASGGWPRAQLRNFDQPSAAPSPVDVPAPKRSEPVVLAAMPAAKPAVAPPKSAPIPEPQVLAAQPAVAKPAPDTEPAKLQPVAVVEPAKPEILAAMPARVAASELRKPEPSRTAPEVLAAMPIARPAQAEVRPVVAREVPSPPGGISLPPLKPASAPAARTEAAAAPAEAKPETPAAPAASLPPAVMPQAAEPQAAATRPAMLQPGEFEIVEPDEPSNPMHDAVSALGALAAGLAKSSSMIEAAPAVVAPSAVRQAEPIEEPKPAAVEAKAAEIIPVEPVVAPVTPTVAAISHAPVTAQVEAPAPAPVTVAAPAPAATAPAPLQAQASVKPIPLAPVEPPVVRAAQVTIAPVRPKLPAMPVFAAPPPAPTAPPTMVPAAPEAITPAAPATMDAQPEAQPAAPPAPLLPAAATPEISKLEATEAEPPTEPAAEPEVDALAMLSAAMTSAAAPASSEMLSDTGPSKGEEQADAGDAIERTLEDTVAELLRPMLRQWLSDNMPRIVEKALRIELAQGLKTGGKPRG